MSTLTRLVVAGCAAVLLTACSGSSTLEHRTTPSAPGTPSTQSPGTRSTTPAQSGARFTAPARVAAILADTRRDMEVANSYDYRRLPQDLAAGLAVTSGTYRQDFRRSFTAVIEPAARKLRHSQTATVQEIGIDSVSAGAASVLVLGKIASVDTRSPKGRTDSFTAVAGARLVSGRWLVDTLVTDGRTAGTPEGTADLRAANTAARAGVISLLSYRRARFDADYARAVARTTGALRTDVISKKASTKQVLTTGKFDLQATVRASATAAGAGRSAVVLVVADAYRVYSGGRRSAVTVQRLKVTLVLVGGKWLLRNLQSVASS